MAEIRSQHQTVTSQDLAQLSYRTLGPNVWLRSYGLFLISTQEMLGSTIELCLITSTPPLAPHHIATL